MLRLTRAFELRFALAMMLVSLASVACFYIYAGTFGFGHLLRAGIPYWTSVTADDPALPRSIRVALSGDVPKVSAGSVVWMPIGQGLDVSELPVMAGDQEVDRIYLTRIDPGHYRFVTANDPTGLTTINEWRQSLGAVAVVNGSYYSRYGLPETPVIADGQFIGPTHYEGSQGAFVATSTDARVVDLAVRSWQSAFSGASNALLSYPLLVDRDRPRPSVRDSLWLANRTFVGQDSGGRILFGTSEGAFFSLRRLSDFLYDAPLDLRLALNLDGGPVACQAVVTAAFSRDVCGRWELQSDGQRASLLRWTGGSWGLPVVLAAVAKVP